MLNSVKQTMASTNLKAAITPAPLMKTLAIKGKSKANSKETFPSNSLTCFSDSKQASSLNRYQRRQKPPKLYPWQLQQKTHSEVEIKEVAKSRTHQIRNTKGKENKDKKKEKIPISSYNFIVETSLAPQTILSAVIAGGLRWRYQWPSAHKALATIVYLAAIICVVPIANGSVSCPIGCSCDDEALVVKCIEGALDVLPITLNPSTKRLVVTNNKKIRTIDSSITFYAELTYLDLSFNELVHIPARTFAFQKKLQELNLSHNKIGQVNNETFFGLSLVNVLNLRGNLIGDLGPFAFGTVTKIEELNLGENRISVIDPRAFDGLHNLRVLYLDDNTMTTVPSLATLQAMPNLAELFLSTNSFETLPSGAFEHVKGLTRLDLHSAGLVYNISVDALKGLERLRSLDLSDNRLQQIPTNSLRHLQRLEELSIGQNDFEIIQPDAFAGLKNLRRLDIADAHRLQRISNGAFAENSNLEHLNFSGNKILSIIEENALRGLPHLRHVIFRENHLSSLAEELFPWADLETLDLSNNPLICDCHLVWLRNLLVSNNKSSNGSAEVLSPGAIRIESITCAYPEQLSGKPLVQLSPTEIGCAHISSNNQALISLVIVGVTVIISAIVFITYGCRQRIRETLKGGWSNPALGRKEREYQKTFSDEEYMTRQQHPCLGLGVPTTIATSPYLGDQATGNLNSQFPTFMESRPIPVTEL